MTKEKSATQKLKERLLKDPEFKAEYERTRPYAEIAREIVRIRCEKGLTQKQLAELMGTTQSAIARIESQDYGRIEFQTLEKVANALGKTLKVSFQEAC